MNPGGISAFTGSITLCFVVEKILTVPKKIASQKQLAVHLRLALPCTSAAALHQHHALTTALAAKLALSS